MNTKQTEQTLKRLFSELKEQDSLRIPAFRAPKSSSAGSRIRGAGFPRLQFAVGMLTLALLVSFIGFIGYRWHLRSARMEIQRWTMLSNWSAPTDKLLGISSLPWGSSVTVPSDSLIDISPASPAKRSTMDKL
jgi:hypothetical protein